MTYENDNSTDSGGSNSEPSSSYDVPFYSYDNESEGGASALSQAPNATRSAAFESALKELFLGSLPSTAGPEFLRSIVEREQWFVPVTPDGAFEPLAVLPGRYALAIDPHPAAHAAGTGPKKTRRRNGVGGRLLPIYESDPGRPVARLDGRSLARALPPDTDRELDGLLVHVGETRPTELRREHFVALRSLPVACDLEDLLATPGPEQIDALKRATWLVAMRGTRLDAETVYGREMRVVPAYTHTDRVPGYVSNEIVAMDGERLFRLLVEDETVDGIQVNPRHTLGRGTPPIRNVVLSPGFAHQALQGQDIRPGVRPLPARSRAEVELWLDQRQFPRAGRRLVEAGYPDETLIRATIGDSVAPDVQARRWRMQEVLGEQLPDPAQLWSPVFTVPTADLAEPGFGSGPTHILCAGLLARDLNAVAYRGKDAAGYWRRGRRLLLGRLLDARDRAESRRRLALANELARLLPPGADAIPRTAALTVEGAAVLRKHPHGGTRAWIEETARQAQRFTRRWVWFG